MYCDCILLLMVDDLYCYVNMVLSSYWVHGATGDKRIYWSYQYIRLT